jgi:hypothetical protein
MSMNIEIENNLYDYYRRYEDGERKKKKHQRHGLN